MSQRLRIVTLNFWGTESPLSQRLALAEKQLRALNVDVVCMQEVRPLDGRAGRTTAHVLADALGMTATYEVAIAWADGGFGAGTSGGQEGLAILSRYPVLQHLAIKLPEARPTEARILLSAQLDTPAGELWVHTTHLHYRLDDGMAREQQVLAIDEAVRQSGRSNDDAPQILCGDFNATPDSDEMRFLRGLTTLGARRTHFQDAWLRLHPEPQRGDGPAQGITWSSENELTRPLRSLDIDRRIDYVYVTSRKRDGRGTVHACDVVLTDREQDLAASDHYGVLAEIQIGAT